MGDPDGGGALKADAKVLVRLAVVGLCTSHSAGALQMAGWDGAFASAASTSATHVELDGLHVFDAWWQLKESTRREEPPRAGEGDTGPFFGMLATSLPEKERDVVAALLNGATTLTPAAPVDVRQLAASLRAEDGEPFLRVLLHTVEKGSSPLLLGSSSPPVAFTDWAGLRARAPQATPAAQVLGKGTPTATSITDVTLSSQLALSWNAETVHQLLVWTSSAVAPQKPAAAAAAASAPGAVGAAAPGEALALAPAPAAAPAPDSGAAPASDTSHLHVFAVGLSLGLAKEKLRRRVARVDLVGLDVALASGGGGPSTIRVSIQDLVGEDCCTVGSLHKRFIGRDAALAAPGVPFITVAITNRAPDAVEAVGENSLVVAVAPARITYLAQQLNEVLDYLQTGIVKVLGAPPPPLPREVLEATD
jgi:hypothetical protein